jgi:hypothetical protein
MIGAHSGRISDFLNELANISQLAGVIDLHISEIFDPK